MPKSNLPFNAVNRFDHGLSPYWMINFDQDVRRVRWSGGTIGVVSDHTNPLSHLKFPLLPLFN
jgi:hypothetical protein